MIVLIILVVALVAVVGSGLLGIGVFGGDGDDGRPRSGILAAISVPVVLGIGVALLAVLFLGVVGLRGGREPSPEAAPSTTETTTAPAPRTPSERPQPLPSARVEAVVGDLPVVLIGVAEEDRFSVYRPVSGLTPGGVVRVRAEGFAGFERGQIEQCLTELGRETACSVAFPVQFDEDGRADFQFAVRGDFAPGGCRVGAPTCWLRVTGNESGRRGLAQTVLVDRFVPGQVTVAPARALADGQTVEVSVTGFPAGVSATAVLCAPPDVYDARRCASGPTSTFSVDGGGSGRTTLVVAAGRLGPDAALCGPRRPCGVAVVVGPGFIAAPAAPLAFSLGPGVAYDRDRLVPGVLVALVLVAVAVGLAWRTDWTKPTEAATPALDGADLRADQDLDQLFGTDEELDQRDPIPW